MSAPGGRSSLASSAMDVAGGRLASLSVHVAILMHLGDVERGSTHFNVIALFIVIINI